MKVFSLDHAKAALFGFKGRGFPTFDLDSFTPGAYTSYARLMRRTPCNISQLSVKTILLNFKSIID